MEETEVMPGDRPFSVEQITRVKAAIETNPQLARALISSAQGGDEGDLRFIMEAGIVVSKDGGEAGGLIIIGDEPRPTN